MVNHHLTFCIHISIVSEIIHVLNGIYFFQLVSLKGLSKEGKKMYNIIDFK